jgi:PAS domain S-box-containing protein
VGDRAEHQNRDAAGVTPTPFPRSEPDGLASIDLIPDPVIGVDADRRITLWNRAAERTYGFTSAEALGQRPPELLLSQFPIPLLEILEAVTDAGHWRGDVVQRAKDGRELTVESRWTARYDEHGNVSGGLEIDRQMTDLPAGRWPRELGEGAVNGHRVGEATAELVHEFNNLLTIILNYAAVITGQLEAIELSSADPRWALMRQDLSEVQLAGERAARLIHQLVAVSRQDASGLDGD